MEKLSYEEYVEQVVDPLFYSIADGFYAGCKTIAERFGIEPPSLERCTKTALCIWQDEEMYDWVPETLQSLGINIACEDWEW